MTDQTFDTVLGNVTMTRLFVEGEACWVAMDSDNRGIAGVGPCRTSSQIAAAPHLPPASKAHPNLKVDSVDKKNRLPTPYNGYITAPIEREPTH